jgi:hypothetical protein
MDRVLVQRTVDVLKDATQARQIRVSQEKRNISPWCDHHLTHLMPRPQALQLYY